jgi:hypothetical protein
MELTQFQIDNAAQKARELGGDRAQEFYLCFAQSLERDAEKVVRAKAALDRMQNSTPSPVSPWSAISVGALMDGSQGLAQEHERTIMLALDIRKSDLGWQAAIARAMAETIDPTEKASAPPSDEALEMYSKYCGVN